MLVHWLLSLTLIVSTTLGVVMDSEPKFKRLDHVAATSGITLHCAHEHGSACITSALGTIILSAPDLARMIGSAINSMTVDLVRPSEKAKTPPVMTPLRCFS